MTIQTTTPGAELRYTLDGTEPTQSSDLFSGAIPLTSAATLKARAFRRSFEPSDVITAVFQRQSAPQSPAAVPVSSIPAR